MANDMDDAIADWIIRVDAKTKEIISAADKGYIKAAFFCEGEAKKNAIDMIYSISIPTGADGKALWRRTGLYKASIGSGLDPDNPHSAIVFNTAPYAHEIEYGSSDAYGSKGGHQGRPVMTNSVFNNKPEIKTILEKSIGVVVK